MFKKRSIEFCLYFVFITLLIIFVVYISKNVLSGSDDQKYNDDNYASVFLSSDENDIVEEDFWGGGKRHVRFKNCGNDTMYLKVTPYFSVIDKNGELCDCIVRDDRFADIDYNNWIKNGVGYIYKYPLQAGKYTQFFVNNCMGSDIHGNTVAVDFVVKTYVYSNETQNASIDGLTIGKDGVLGVE